MTEVLNRTISGRLFSGTYDAISDTDPTKIIGSIFDRINMPALVLEPGKQCYYDFELAQDATTTLPRPYNQDTANRLYVAVQCNHLLRITYTSPTHGSGLIVLLKATDSDDDGTHYGLWTYQGTLTNLAISVPQTSEGGVTTQIQVFMYEIPDLEDPESYFDKQIGLGVTGDD